MSWRDRLTQKGSFRDVEFWVETDGHEFSPRTTVHEYPKRDEPYVESNGQGKFEYSVSAVVIGVDYDQQRNKLIDALAANGPGTLHHPFYGTFQASVIKASKRESTKAGGKATFNITFVKGGDIRYPTVANNTADAVEKAAAAVQDAAGEDFEDDFSVLDQAQEMVDEVVDEINNALDAIDAAVSSVTDPIAAIISAPAQVAASVMGTIGSVQRSIAGPINALNIYKDLFSSGSDRAALPQSTPAQQQQVKNLQAVDLLIQRAAFAGAAATTATMAFKTADQALAIANALADAIDAHVATVDLVGGGAIDDAVYNTLLNLKTSVVKDLHQRSAQLPRLIEHTLSAPVPAIVLAYQLYSDVGRAQEIIDKNSIQHPGFLPGGKPLQVLNK